MKFPLTTTTPHAPHNTTTPTPMHINDVDCAVSCPSLMAFPNAWPLWIIVCLYSLLFLLSLMFLWKSRHQGLTSFKNMFLILQASSAGLRILFFSVTLPWTYFSLYLLYIMFPIYIQFLTISLLVVFLWKCILNLNNQTHLVTKVLYPVAGIAFALLGVVCAVYAWLANKHHSDNTGSEGYDWYLSGLSTFTFGIITLCLIVVAYRSSVMLRRLSFSHDKQKKVSAVKYMFFLYIALLSLRTLWSGFYAASINPLQSRMNDLQEQSDKTAYYGCILAFYFVFEFFPSICLLAMLYSWLPRGRTSVMKDVGVHTPLIQK